LKRRLTLLLLALVLVALALCLSAPLPTSLVPALVQRVWRLHRLARKVQDTAAC